MHSSGTSEEPRFFPLPLNHLFACNIARMWVTAFCFALIIVFAVPVVWFVVSRNRYYKRIFSVESFREFHGALLRAVAAAQRQQAEAPPSPDDGTAFVTSSGLAVGVTCSKESSGPQTFTILHISLSQAGQITTHALCSRFGFFVVAMLRDMKGELTPVYSDSGVHHLVFRFQEPALRLQDFDLSYARYAGDYRPIPFRRRQIEADHGAAP